MILLLLLLLLLLFLMAFLRASRRPLSTKILLVKSLTGPLSLKWIMELSEPGPVVEAGNSSGVEDAGAAVVLVEDSVVDVMEVVVVVVVAAVVVGASVVVMSSPSSDHPLTPLALLLRCFQRCC